VAAGDTILNDRPTRARCLVIGAPESDARDSWVLVTFLEQREGGWSTMGSTGVTPYEDD